MKTKLDSPWTASPHHLMNGNFTDVNHFQSKQSWSNNDFSLIEDPAQYGYRKLEPRFPQRVPKYLVNEQHILEALPPFQNDWDRANQMELLESECSGLPLQDLYEQFQKKRDIERSKMESLGLVDAENTRKKLDEAIIFRGSCYDMCPTFERIRRSLENNVKKLEKDPLTNKISRTRAVKAFSRPAAGQPPPLPSDVRPPTVLTTSLDYLVETALDELPEAQSFIWDRTRSIRQDFTYQNYCGPEALECTERIVRIHLLVLHVMAGNSIEYSQQQEIEQLNKALQTLMEFYEVYRSNGTPCSNEPEFRCYALISHFRDPELQRDIPKDIISDPHIQIALKMRGLISQSNIMERGHENVAGCLNLFTTFFQLCRSGSTPLLLTFLLETKFNEIRFYALKAMSRCYHSHGKPLFLSQLVSMLGFDNEADAVEYLNYWDLEIDVEDGLAVCNVVDFKKWTSIHDKPRQKQAFSKTLDTIAGKFDKKSLVNGKAPKVLPKSAKPAAEPIPKKPYVREPEKVVSVAPPLLVDLPLFPHASRLFMEEALQSVVSSQISTIVTSVVQSNHQDKRSRYIASLGEQLFDAFVKDNFFQTALEAQAECFGKLRMQKLLLRALKPVAEKILSRRKDRQRRRNELLLFRQNLGKRILRASSNERLSNTSCNTTANNTCFDTSVNNTSLNTIHTSQELDLERIFRKPLSSPNSHIKLLILAEDSGSASFNWLANILGLEEKANRHIRTISNSNASIFLTTLPDDFEPSAYFKDAGFILLLFMGNKKEEKVLAKVVEFIKQCSRVKPAILILYYGAIPIQMFSRLLKLDCVAAKPYIASVYLVKMSHEQALLKAAMKKMVRSFNFERTLVGNRAFSEMDSSPKKRPDAPHSPGKSAVLYFPTPKRQKPVEVENHSKALELKNLASRILHRKRL